MIRRVFTRMHKSALELALLAAASTCVWVTSLHAIDRVEELCLYTSAQGAIVQVNSRAEVPEELRGSARCLPEKPVSNSTGKAPSLRATPVRVSPNVGGLAAPDDIRLDGNLRSASINSPLGPISLRWPRSVETLFGRTPERAMVDAAGTVSRALKQGSFPPKVQHLRLEWNVVFMEHEPSANEAPPKLISNCHPAWMTPPSNIYVVSERVAAGCGGQKMSPQNADAQLAEILVHEIGHAVEFQLLQPGARFEPARAEGFATWFEEYAGRYSSLIDVAKVKARHSTLARESLKSSPEGYTFAYSLYDYARASLAFRVLTDRRGIPGLLATYRRLARAQLPLEAAACAELGMSDRECRTELKKSAE